MEEPPRRIVRAADGRILVRLAPREREILADLAAELAHETASPDVIDPTDAGLARLWPDAVAGDREASSAFRELIGADLAEVRQARFATLAATVDATSLDDAQASAWLGAVNDLRLVHGSRLGVTEETGTRPVDERDPEADDTIVYLWLGWVEEQLVDALASALPELGTPPR